ncbi:hypothetical protein Hanom_Chr00s000001g01594541 [Helianthus anomalus]
MIFHITIKGAFGIASLHYHLITVLLSQFMRKQVPVFEHLSRFEGCRVVDQWLQGADEGGFAKFVPGADQPRTQT